MNQRFSVSILLFSAFAAADADLELISITSLSGIGFITPTTFVEAEFKFRNNGPDVIRASEFGIGTAFSANAGSRTIDVQPSSRFQPCRYIEEVIDDGPNSLLALVTLVLDRPFLPGETLSCFAMLGAYREAPDIFNQDFFAIAPNNPDPNFDNNRLTITIRTRAIPPVVNSVPISGIAYCFMGLVLLGIGFFAIKRIE